MYLILDSYTKVMVANLTKLDLCMLIVLLGFSCQVCRAKLASFFIVIFIFLGFIRIMSMSGLNNIEKKAAFSLASVFGVRMLGLFMILPVFAIYGEHLTRV